MSECFAVVHLHNGEIARHDHATGWCVVAAGALEVYGDDHAHDVAYAPGVWLRVGWHVVEVPETGVVDMGADRPHTDE